MTIILPKEGDNPLCSTDNSQTPKNHIKKKAWPKEKKDIAWLCNRIYQTWTSLLQAFQPLKGQHSSCTDQICTVKQVTLFRDSIRQLNAVGGQL